ncbi:response regulator transcription factor [Actinoplanes sp. OR16]|uniref:response regulator transcription factor n=1 Tax=Actinoplanes sp. OR16 TaxID=946334 RepID=UPI000FDB1021|nr:response regulator transcription factor [Actinoplanes sp. OR16]
MRRIRILLAVPVELRAEFDRGLAGADDVEVVGAAERSMEILLTTGDLRPDVVVLLMIDDDVPGVATHLLSEYPDVRILCVSADRQRIAVCELEPRLVMLAGDPGGGLAGAVRQAMGREVPDP